MEGLEQNLVLERIESMRVLMETKLDYITQKLNSHLSDHESRIKTDHYPIYEKIEHNTHRLSLLEDRVKDLEASPGKNAATFLKWLGMSFGILTVGGIVTLIVYGVAHWIKTLPL